MYIMYITYNSYINIACVTYINLQPIYTRDRSQWDRSGSICIDYWGHIGGPIWFDPVRFDMCLHYKKGRTKSNRLDPKR